MTRRKNKRLPKPRPGQPAEHEVTNAMNAALIKIGEQDDPYLRPILRYNLRRLKEIEW